MFWHGLLGACSRAGYDFALADLTLKCPSAEKYGLYCETWSYYQHFWVKMVLKMSELSPKGQPKIQQ